MLGDLTTYEIIALMLSGATILLAIISVWISIRSSKKTSEDTHRLIADMNRSTRARLAVESRKLEVEKYKITMEIVALMKEKEKLQEKGNLDVSCLMGPNGRERIKEIDEQIERLNNVFYKMGYTQADINEAINKFSNQ